MEASRWLNVTGRKDAPEDWLDYVDWLVDLVGDERALKKEGLLELSRGWALGTPGWKRAMAQEHRHLALHPSLEKKERQDLLETHARHLLNEQLKAYGKTVDDIVADKKGAPWKIEIAASLSDAGLATNRWLAAELKMGHPRAVSSYLSKFQRK